MFKHIGLYLFIVSALALSAVARGQSNGSPIVAQSSDPMVQQTVINLSPPEARFLQIINEFRRRLGLNELRLHVGLQAAAAKHSQWMAAQDVFTLAPALSHFGPTPTTEFSTRILTEGYANYTMLGENVACGSESAIDTFKQFAFSPSHLSNMLSPRYRHIGIARAGTGNEACPYYWTNDFGSKADPATDLPAVTDVTQIAEAIDAVSGLTPTEHPPTAQILINQPAAGEEKPLNIQCVVPYAYGKGVLATAVNTHTTLDLSPNSGGYMLKLSYHQEGTAAQFVGVAISGAMVVKSPFYPLVTIFSAPNNRVGGFMIQIDLPTERAQFDPYPGHGGTSGLINCKVR